MTNKTILITGAARRIGAAIARGLHGTNMDIIIHYNKSRTEAETLASELNSIRTGSVFTIAADLLDTDNIAAFLKSCYSFNKRLDVLVNNASVFYPSLPYSTSAKQWGEIIGINLKAPYFLSTLASGYLAENKGCIINLGDIYAERPLDNYSIYNISKAGLLMQTKSLARELGPDIRVNSISPGAILWSENIDEKSKQAILERTVFRQPGKISDIVNAVYFLIENAEYMTGQNLTIDGGRTLYC